MIPLLYLLRNPGSALVVVGLREESFKLLNSPFVYAYDVIRNVVYPFLIALALGYYLSSRRPLWLVLFLVTAGVGVFYAAASIAKTPVAVIMLVTALFVYLYRGGRFGWRTMVVSFLGGVRLSRSRSSFSRSAAWAFTPAISPWPSCGGCSTCRRRSSTITSSSSRTSSPT